MENLSTAKWGPAPPLLPPGAQIAVLAGDPTKAAPYSVRLKFPAGYAIPAHSHPTDEHVAVVSGELFMGMGTRLDMSAGLGLGVGGFALMPANANHFAYTKNETTIVLYGQGPVEFKVREPGGRSPREDVHEPQVEYSGPRRRNWGFRFPSSVHASNQVRSS